MSSTGISQRQRLPSFSAIAGSLGLLLLPAAKAAALIVSLSWIAGLSTACTTLNEDRGGKAETPPPKITDETPLDEAVEAGIRFGGDTLTEVKKRVSRRKEWVVLEETLTKVLSKDIAKLKNEEIANGIHLYQITSRETTPEIIQSMLASDRPIVRQMAWQLAARNPSKKVAAVIERELTKAVWDGDEERVLIPEMALAVQANQIRSVYTLLRQGLLMQGSEEYAKAMIDLAPEKASNDFMAYLAQATIEDLRQLNQQSVNLYACVTIFRFYLTHTLPVNHPGFSHLYLYAVSRNQMLAEMAQAVLEKQLGGSREQLVYALARMPVWIQVAYIEGTRMNPNPNVSLFLDDLKKLSAHKEVIEEIESRR